MLKSLKIMLWGEEVGRLSWSEQRQRTYFTFHPEFLKKGWDVSPLVAPIHGASSLLPVWGEEAKMYQKLPAFVADSLPDSWGNQLFDLWRRQQHLSNAEINPLDKLSFIGKRGIGALEFIPEVHRGKGTEKVNVQSLAEMANRIFMEREQARIQPGESLTMQSLLTIGTSAGGRTPKAIIAVNAATGEIRSGLITSPEGYEYYILKFGNIAYSMAELEMTYYKLATLAGIRMMPSRLLEVDGVNHFITKRFDRQGEKKFHTQTLAAICPEAASYEQLLSVCRKLHLPEADCNEVFRRMIFNILSNNTDDHNKNFSFIMNEEGVWRLAPAYDLTYIVDPGGYLPNKDHCMYVRAKLSDITRSDVVTFARENGIRRPSVIIREVVTALKQFRTIAAENGVAPPWIGRVEYAITTHLANWGEAMCQTECTETECTEILFPLQ